MTCVADTGELNVELNLFALMSTERRRDAAMNKEHKQTRTEMSRRKRFFTMFVHFNFSSCLSTV